MTASPAPAAMPGEEEIAKLISGAPFPSPRSLSKARAILALFAPILAEKEREISTFDQREVEWNEAMAGSLQNEEDAHRKLEAAEAALAAERGRCIAIVDAQVPDWVKERSGPYWEGYRDAMEDAADDMRKGSAPHAAAIRAQGE